MIALVEWNVGGHHDGYLVIHARTLLQQGHRLLVLCCDPDGFRKVLGESIDASEQSMLHVAGIPNPEWVRARRRYPMGFAYVAFARKILGEIRRVERQVGHGRFEIFFSCLYEHQTRMIDAVIRRLGGRRWSGLYLHAHAFHHPETRARGVKRKWPISKLWSDRGLRGLLMLDEVMAPRVSAAIHHPVQVMPDITDTSLKEDNPLADELRAFSCERPVIGLFGHIMPTKGVVSFIRCALRDEMQDVVFAIAGSVHWDLFGVEERAILAQAVTGISNVWFKDGRIPDEAEYNALFKSCGLIYAAYENFPHSSNTLTKAAAFRRPVIVHEGTLMGERVRRYRMGAMVSQDCSIEERCQAIQGLLEMDESSGGGNEPEWDGYLAAHSEQRLAEVFAAFFPDAC